jgi:hypothetical protein
MHKKSIKQTYKKSGTYIILASFPVPGAAWSSVPFSHDKEHVIRRVQENKQEFIRFWSIRQTLV